ncbi:TraX family protein [Vreelandella rituensis]|uniref:TraX n=1 Tax=Vreelandella rituensis TaxID=2282306 RepID=A0A368UB22_9GAMM|nr:TraX family protein [Halomonas rituensis]RCV93757.1 hypothetical protein DU506_00970 [Halomonas rituensis]
MLTKTQVIPATSYDRAPAPRSSHWTLWGQWIAVLTMSADHAARFLFREAAFADGVTITVGRIAFPVFAGMVAWHALYNTRSLRRYIGRILLIAIAAQPLVMWLNGYPHIAYLNICFTLALGLGVARWGQHWYRVFREGRRSMALLFIEALAMGLGVLVVSSFFEYGQAGVLLVPLYMLSFHTLRKAMAEQGIIKIAGACGAILMTALIASLANINPVSTLVATMTALGIIVLAAGPRVPIQKPRLCLPRSVWLAWYPVHFAVLALIVHIIG